MSDSSPAGQDLPPKLELGKGAQQAGPKITIKPALEAGASGPTKTVPKPQLVSAETGTEPTLLRIRPEPPPQTDEQRTVLAKKETSRIPLQSAVPAEAVKSDTSRIPLDQARSMAGEVTSNGATKIGLAPRTIRITPGSVSTVQVQKPSAAALPSEEKRKTSRVSLESAVEPSAEATAGPKTIRLKRPAAVGGKLAPTVIRPIGSEDSLSKTAEIEPAEEPGAAAAVSATATQKKTIKVRRPVTRTGIRPIPQEAARGVSPRSIQVVAPEAVEKTGPVFPILAMVAVVVICVIVYLQSSEVFGPDFCLTPYSYAKNGPNLQWPGKMVFGQQ